jgi:hypothetical protein
MSSRRQRRAVHFVCMVLIVLLYIVSVPWYREADAPLRIWLGLPDWVAVALLCYVGVAIANAVAWVVTEVPDTFDYSEESEESEESDYSEVSESAQ